MKRFVAAVIVMLCTVGAARAESPPVGTALVLLIDVSGSIDNTEYDLQKNGIAAAFRDPAVVRAIWNQPYGRMAVAVVEWSDTATVVLPWTTLEDEASSRRFADLVHRIERTSRGSTALGTAVTFAVELFETCHCAAARRATRAAARSGSRRGMPHT